MNNRSIFIIVKIINCEYLESEYNPLTDLWTDLPAIKNRVIEFHSAYETMKGACRNLDMFKLSYEQSEEEHIEGEYWKTLKISTNNSGYMIMELQAGIKIFNGLRA